MTTATTTTGVHHVEHVMGTRFTFDVHDPRVHESALAGAIGWLHWVERTFSPDLPGSEVSRLSAGTLELDDCSAEVIEVLDLCVAVENETGGFFSPLFDRRLDPTGLVKGWAVERASEMLVQVGSRSHCIDGGGDIRTVGESAPGRPWRIGVADPNRPGQVVTSVSGTNLAVATSGPGEGVARILDPHTHTMTPSAIASVTVVGPDLIRADAYATAACAMGDRAYAWLSSLPDYTSVVVDAHGTVWRTPGS